MKISKPSFEDFETFAKFFANFFSQQIKILSDICAPRYDNDICRAQRQRQRHLYTTNGTDLELFISGIEVDDGERRPRVEFHRWNFILKLEGDHAALSVS